MTSIKARTQRRRTGRAPLHRRRASTAAHLDPKLHEKSKVRLPRAVAVRQGDTVRVMRGGFRGREGTVVSVEATKGTVIVEGLTIEKRDEKKVGRPIHASNLMIVKLDDTDPRRRAKFQE